MRLAGNTWQRTSKRRCIEPEILDVKVESNIRVLVADNRQWAHQDAYESDD